MKRRLLGIAGALLAVSAVTGASVSHADDATLTISHVEPSGNDVNILVSVPKGADVDLGKIEVTLDAERTESRAAPAGDDPENQVRRTAILAIDTSNSMRDGRIAAAKTAAKSFISAVPDDVYIGIVTFDGQVKTALSPTLDRAAAAEVVDGLTLALGTLLNDGVIAAVDLAGDEGQRSVLILSDGLNTNDTPLADVESAIKDAGINVDAVALEQSSDDSVPLQAMVAAGEGSLIAAGSAELNAAFAAEAESLARQILITARIPDDVTGTEATVAVTVPTGTGTLSARAFTVVRGEVESSIEVPSATVDEGLQIPRAVMFGGLGALGVGLLILLGGLTWVATSDRTPKTMEQRIAAFGGAGSSPGARKADSGSAFNLDQAKGAAATVLRHNRGLEARIEQRLEAAGSALKSSEWLLMHGAIIMLSGLVGLMVSGGGALMLFVALAAGLVIPWLWLGRKRRKRLKAFNAGLADTLQLISGSLSAGMSLAQSIDTVVAEGNEPIAGEFKRVLVETRLGVPLEEALQGVAERTESMDFGWVVMAIRIQREVGGNLAELLNTVAGTLRERDYLRRQVQTLSAEGRLSGYILGGLPIAMFLYLYLVRREYLRPLYTEPLGLLMLGAAGVLLAMGAFTMSRLVKVEV